MSKSIIHCPVCRQRCREPFYVQTDAPVLSNVLCRTKEEATSAPVGDIELRLCPSCGLIFNARFDPSRVTYEAEYENALHFSSVFREHERRLVSRLVEDFQLTGTNLVEIGCGDGHFLSALCERGGSRGTGFDPAFDFDRHQQDLHGSVTVHPQEFSTSSIAQIRPGGICCRHVLEHLPRPAKFLKELREGLDPQQKTVIYFEVPSAMHSLARRGFWDIIYEHHSYFTAESLRILFERSGFNVLEVEETYSGQFVGLFARPAMDVKEALLDSDQREALTQLTERFGADYQSEIARWTHLIRTDTGRGLVAWGAGSKGVTFLNALGDASQHVTAIVDLNPRKQGCYVVGAAQPIIPPSELHQLQPDRVIVMNAAYLDEIAIQLNQLECGAELLAVA